MTDIEEILNTLQESGIEVSNRDVKSITKFVTENEETNAFEELEYTFDVTPSPAKRPRVGARGFYDPDSAAKKNFTKFILACLGYDEAYIKKWIKCKAASTKKKGIEVADREDAKDFIKTNCIFTGQCVVTLDIYLPVPKTMSEFKKKLAYIGYIRPENKPDIDNFEKFIYDSINSIFFLDDGQIVSNTNNLFYCPENEGRIDMNIVYRPRSLL